MTEEREKPPTAPLLSYVVGIDIGKESCLMWCLTLEKRQVIKPSQFSNTAPGFDWLFEQLQRLPCRPEQILVGLEATSRSGENLSQALLTRGYRLALLHPGQIHAFAQQRGLRAKTDRLDASTIARALLSGEARFGYLPDEQGATYRELVRLQQQLSEDVARSKNEGHALLVVLFPEFPQVFADPSRKAALAVLRAYPSAQAIREADPVALGHLLKQQCPGHYGQQTVQTLIQLAHHSVGSHLATAARSHCLRVLCDQLEHTQANLEPTGCATRIIAEQ